MHRLLLLTVLLLGQGQVWAQEDSLRRFQDSTFGFAMDIPADWYEAPKSEMLKSVEKWEFDRVDRDSILAEYQNRTITLGVFMRDNPKRALGPIPTIQINIRPGYTGSFAQFEAAMLRSLVQIQASVEDFTYLTEPERREVDRFPAFYFAAEMRLPRAGVSHFSRTRTYAIPMGDYFIQLALIDQKGKRDLSALYERLVQSIEIGR